MATKIVMEALSPTMEEGTVVKWLKGEGDAVKTGETLAEVETDKAIMELVARGEGVLRRIFTEAGVAVDVGTLIGVVGTADEDISNIGPSDSESVATEDEKAPQDEATPATSASRAESAPQTPADGRVKASPLARRMASERGLNLTSLQGSGPGGRIVKRDVLSAPMGGAVTTPATPFDDVPLTQIRKTIARRLSESIGPIPHFFLTTEVDMERAADARTALNALGDDTRISFNDIVLKVVAEALVAHRECNAWWQGDHIRYFTDAHISVAVAIPDGLITPVVRNANHKTLRQISQEVRELAARASDKKLTPEEYTGGTFSVSNLGMFGIDQFTGVINPPEAGLLAVGAITDKPVAHEGKLEVRKRMRLTMSCDHRVIDGATGARFLQSVQRMLENPLAMVW
jgi:pyruvate dehydrogenase E2 component (dihydrolipoamide acetyltransferase)